MKIGNDRRIVEKISNKHHVNDMNYALQYTRWLLMLLGIWPLVITKSTRIERCASKILLPFPSISIIAFVLIPVVSHIIFRDLPRPKFLILLGPISFRITNILKNIILVSRRDSIKSCVQHMETDWQRLENENDRVIMKRNLRIGHSLTIVCMASMYSSAIFYQAIMPLLRGKTVNEFNVTVKPLSFPGADIYVDLQVGYNYEMVFSSHCIAALFLYSIVTAVCNLAAVLVTHACGQIQIVMSRLENLVDDNQKVRDRVIKDRIAFIVRYHVRVLRFSSRIDEVLREMCFIEVVASTLIICLLEYYCMTEWQNSSTVAIITYLLLLLSLCFNLFIFCHIGELLQEKRMIKLDNHLEKCQQVGRATYMMNWYQLPGKTGLALVMITAMANYPRKLTAGRMMELSYFTFGTIIKTSFAYLGMLRSMIE